MKLNHGGQLTLVAEDLGLTEDNWLDLSTGISPYNYPIPEIPLDTWRCLPQVNASLLEAAKRYYQTEQLLATSGSQAVIQALPRLWRAQAHLNQDTRVFLPSIGYKEHEKSWQKSGLSITHYQGLTELEHLSGPAIVIVINPNNPTGQLYDKQELMALYHRISQHQGWLIIDEAFMDTRPGEHSLMGDTDKAGLWILRSLGKFFGLAGIRMGFASAQPVMLELLADELGPWPVNGPAQLIAEQALKDASWQQKQRQRLGRQSEKLAQVLKKHFSPEQLAVTSLFITVKTVGAIELFNGLAREKVYIRLCDEKDALRFGIPDNQGLARLEKSLAKVLYKLAPAEPDIR